MAITGSNTPLQITIHPANTEAFGPAAPAAPQSFWSGEAPSFKDFLDIINPLQHIPVVSSLYQSMTGDIQSPAAKLAGGALFGGPLGFMTSLFDSIVQSATGTDISGNIIAAIEGKPVPALHNGETEVAQAGDPGYLSPNQRAGYNAYVRASSLV